MTRPGSKLVGCSKLWIHKELLIKFCIFSEILCIFILNAWLAGWLFCLLSFTAGVSWLTALRVLSCVTPVVL